jgi:hypothetical protein
MLLAVDMRFGVGNCEGEVFCHSRAIAIWLLRIKFIDLGLIRIKLTVLCKMGSETSKSIAKSTDLFEQKTYEQACFSHSNVSKD